MGARVRFEQLHTMVDSRYDGWALPVRRYVAVPRCPLGPVGWHSNWVSSNLGVLGRCQQGPCAHGHSCPSYHPHGSHAVVARSRYGDGGRVEGCGGDAVRLHHGGVMDHMWLSRIHWLGVVRSLSGRTQERVNVDFI